MPYKPLVSAAIPPDPTHTPDEIYFDVETLRLSHEVLGGWKSIKNFGLAVAVTWDPEGQFRAWYEEDAEDLIRELHLFPRVVTFNGERFDFEVLSAYGDVSALYPKSFDVLTHLHKLLGFRVKLDDLAQETLGHKKTADGLQAVAWWRQGEKDKVTDYCSHDVELLVRLVAHARESGFVVIDGRRVKVEWRR